MVENERIIEQGDDGDNFYIVDRYGGGGKEEGMGWEGIINGGGGMGGQSEGGSNGTRWKRF